MNFFFKIVVDNFIFLINLIVFQNHRNRYCEFYYFEQKKKKKKEYNSVITALINI